MLWVSHRGYTESFTENTKEAFEEALRIGFPAIETDLRLTADSHIVLSHDTDLKRLIGKETKVSTLTREELLTIRLPRKEHFYFWEELIEDFPEVSWTFDIKEPAGLGTVKALVEKAHERGLLDWLQNSCRFLFWSKKTQDYFESLVANPKLYSRLSEARLYCGLRRLGLEELFPLKEGKIYGLPHQALGLNFFKPKEVKKIQTKKAETIAFLPQTLEETEKALAAGFDEILTNLKPQL